MQLKVISFFILLFTAVITRAQTQKVKNDTAFYELYPGKLVITPYLEKNVSGFSFTNPASSQKIKFHTNAPVGIGLRLDYNWFSFSGSYGVGIIDPNFNKAKGKTQSLNIKTTIASKFILADIYFQQTKGFYLQPQKKSANTVLEPFYTRPDIRNRLIGFSGMYVLNGKKFTVRPAFKFDARQKKAAGSFVTGIEFFTGYLKGDSSLIPSFYSATHSNTEIKRINYTFFGPGVGYGHSFVLQKYFFITALGALNADIGHLKEFNNDKTFTEKGWRFNPNLNFRGGLGYNKPSWEIAFSCFTKRIFLANQQQANRYQLHNNIYKLSFTKRINAGKNIPKTVNWAGSIIDKMGFGFLID
ncbi:MAG: DUF4421 family protein [Niabella sp.]